MLTWIAEVAKEPLALEPADRRVEWETNTWLLGGSGDDRHMPEASEVVAVFERVADRLRARIRERGRWPRTTCPSVAPQKWTCANNVKPLQGRQACWCPPGSHRAGTEALLSLSASHGRAGTAHG